MLKIVHVSNFGLKPKGNFQHSVSHKISNGLIRNGHFVSNFSDRDVARSKSILGSKVLGTHYVNKALFDFCCHIQPDILILGHVDIIKSKTLSQIRQSNPSIKILQWTGDLLLSPQQINNLSSKFSVVDATLLTMSGSPLAAIGKLTPGFVGFLPVPVDFSVESGRNHEKILPYDLFYACSSPAGPRHICDEYWLPEKLFQQIERCIPEIRLNLTGLRGAPSLVGGRYQQALESAAIGLNMSARNDCPLYTSDRLAHICGNGQAVLIDRATGYDRFFNDSEFAFFSTIDEMIEKTRRLVMDTPHRQALAKAGRAKYHELFNEQLIAKYIIDVAMGNLKEHDYPWPTSY